MEERREVRTGANKERREKAHVAVFVAVSGVVTD